MAKDQGCLPRLMALGMSDFDARALRRIAMTLHRWHELECGDGNEHGSWCIVRGQKIHDEFTYDDGTSYMEQHHYRPSGPGSTSVNYRRIPDREKGAKRHLANIMAGYPNLVSYVQGDPRGAALYILRKDQVRDGEQLDCIYSRGVAVYK